MEYIIAGKNDTEELIRMRIAYIDEDLGGLSEKTTNIMKRRLHDYFEKHLNNDLFVFAAKEHEKIVSTAFLLIIQKPSNPDFINGLVGNVLNVYTMPECRRQGISTKLMTMLIAYAKEKSLDFIELMATEAGFPLYKKLGFEVHEPAYTGMRLRF